jgi:chaperonin GroES
MNIRPLHDRVIVKRKEKETTTASGIIIPDSGQETPAQGTIVAVGNGKVLENGDVRTLEVKVGDVVLFGKYSGTEFKADGDEFLYMNESDIIGVIE